MTTQFLLIMLLGASVYAMPKPQNSIEKQLPPVLMPGPVLLPGNDKDIPIKSDLDETCQLCELVVTQIDKLLKQNSTEQEIKETLDKLCAEIPEISSECKTFVDEYVDPILKAFSEMSPEMICKALGLCQANKAINNEISLVRSTPQCQLCEMMVKELESLITANSTQQEIEQALEQVCGLLPSSYKSDCDSLVEQYTPAILDILANEFSPDMICTTLQLCGSSGIMSRFMGNTSLCDTCKEVVGFVKKLVEDNTTEADFEKTLKLICWYMLPIKSQCDNFVDKFVSMLFDELKKFDPETICKDIKMCPSQFVANDIRCFLKGQKPCEDLELSKKCGTETYCKFMKAMLG